METNVGNGCERCVLRQVFNEWKNERQLSQFKAGDKVRLRISNGGASTYFG